jgi:hypothetical protein
LAGAWGVFGVQNTWEAGVEREEAQGKRLATLAPRGRRRTLRLHIRGIGAQADGHPALRQQVAHRGNRARPPLPLVCDPASGVLHGEPPGALQSPGRHAGLGARAGHEAADDCGAGHRLGSARARSPTPRP